MFPGHRAPAEGRFISPAKAGVGESAGERRLRRANNAVVPSKAGIRSARLSRTALHCECNAHGRMWQNSPNLGERGTERRGGSAPGTNFCRDLWARHPNLSSAERQLRDLSSEGEKKATTPGHALNDLKGKEGRGKGAEVAGQAAPGPRCAVGGLLLPPAPRVPQRRVPLSPRQRKHTCKAGGMLPAARQERGEAEPAAPSLRAYLQPPVPAAPRSRSMPCRRRSPTCPGEARAAAVTWEYRIWYKL